MDIQNLSVAMSQARLQEEAAVRVQAMILQDIRDGAAVLSQAAGTAENITDPAKGALLDLYM